MGLPSLKAAWQKNGDPGGHKVAHEAAMHPCGKEAECCHWALLPGQGGDPFPLFSMGQITLSSTGNTGTYCSESSEGP